MTLRTISGCLYARIRLSAGEKGRRKDVAVPDAWMRQAEELDRRLTEVADALREADQPVAVIERMLAEVLIAKDDGWKALQRAVALVTGGKTVRAARGATTFGEFATEYLSGDLCRRFPDRVDVRTLKAVTDDEARLRLYILPHLRNLPLTAITLDTCDDVMATVPTTYKGGRPMRRATRRHVAQVLRRMLGLAAYPCKYIPLSPIPRGWLPKAGRPPAYPFLYPDEDARLLACTEIPLVNRLLYGFLAREGMRGPSEAVAMQIHRIDLAHGTYGLGDNKTDDPRGWMLSPDVTRALKLWLDELHPNPSPEALLFVEHTTGLSPINDSRSLAKVFRKHLHEAGVERAELFETSDLRRPIRAHDLRATFITLALARGRSEQWVMDRTGHTTSGMLQRYRRAARTVAEANMTTLTPLDSIPELAALVAKAEVPERAGDEAHEPLH